jgi:glucose-1-phosphate adenylyltransferase
MGIYAFRTDSLRQVLLEDAEREGSQHDFGKDIIPRLVQCGEVISYDFRDPVEQTPLYWRDIGTVDAYYESSMDLVCPDPPFEPFHRAEWPAFSHGACVRGGRVRRSVLSAGVRIEEKADVEDSVLMEGVRVGAGARIRRAIVQENVSVPAGARIGFNPESDRGRYFVTETGITVVGDLMEETRPIPSQNHIAPFLPGSLRLRFERRRFRRARAS